MQKATSGIIHGRMIQLAEDLGWGDGESVEVLVTNTSQRSRNGDGFRRSAGVLAGDWSDEDDRILAELTVAREKAGRPEIDE